MVDSRWAMTMRVHFILSRASETFRWVMLSRAEVASSKIRIFGFGAMARAIIRRWRCPPEMVPPPSCSTVCMPMGISRISSAMPAISAASQASSSFRVGAEITILSKMLPEKSFPSCITAPICRRTECRSRCCRSCQS